MLECGMFVGRERETRWLVTEFGSGHHPILTGKYGIGRTALVRAVVGKLKPKRAFVFLNASQTPMKLCRDIYRTLNPADYGSLARLSFPMLRYRVVNTLKQSPAPVLVWDDIATMSRARLDLLRRLVRSGRFSIVAVVEEFLPADHLNQLRTILAPAPVLRLTYLSPSESRDFFRRSNARYPLGLSERKICELARLTHGYPTEMVNLVERLRAQSECKPP